MNSPITNQPFTTEDADRLLGLADQFLEDWTIDVVNAGKPDPNYEERMSEWQAIRPLLALAPAMLAALEAQECARDLRRAVLEQLGSSIVPPERKPFDFLTHGTEQGGNA